MVLHRRAAGVAVLVAWGAVACGASSSGSGAGGGSDGGSDGSISDPFVGTWACTGTSTTNETMPTTMTTMDDTMSSIVITDDGSGNLTIVRTPEGDAAAPPCTESATLGAGGMTATFKGMPMCTTATSTISETFTTGMYTMGSGGTTFAGMTTYSLSGTTSAGKAYAATGSSSSTCMKM
jgi:hypothetical protein